MSGTGHVGPASAKSTWLRLRQQAYRALVVAYEKFERHHVLVTVLEVIVAVFSTLTIVLSLGSWGQLNMEVAWAKTVLILGLLAYLVGHSVLRIRALVFTGYNYRALSQALRDADARYDHSLAGATPAADHAAPHGRPVPANAWFERELHGIIKGEFSVQVPAKGEDELETLHRVAALYSIDCSLDVYREVDHEWVERVYPFLRKWQEVTGTATLIVEYKDFPGAFYSTVLPIDPNFSYYALMRGYIDSDLVVPMNVGEGDDLLCLLAFGQAYDRSGGHAPSLLAEVACCDNSLAIDLRIAAATILHIAGWMAEFLVDGEGRIDPRLLDKVVVVCEAGNAVQRSELTRIGFRRVQHPDKGGAVQPSGRFMLYQLRYDDTLQEAKDFMNMLVQIADTAVLTADVDANGRRGRRWPASRYATRRLSS